MCALAHNMESLLFTVTVLLGISYDAAKHSADCTPGKSIACAVMNVDKAHICYTKSKHKWKATIICNEGTLTGPDTYTCQNSTKIWTPSFASSCAGTYRSSGYLGCFEDNKDRVLQGKMHTSTQNSGDYCKSICKTFRYAGTEYGHECYCGNSMRVVNASNGCYAQCPGNQDEKCGGGWRISIYDTWQVQLTTTSALTTTQSPNKTNASTREPLAFSDIPVTTASASTTCTTEMPNKTNVQDNTALSSLASSNGTGSVVVPVVLVFVVIVITIAAVIVFIVWRRKRLRSLTDTGDNSGTTDMHYQDLRPDHSAESEYTEFLTKNLNAEETADTAYQTIDSLPEDQTECSSGYGHLKIHTTKSNDDYYLNVAVNKLGSRASIDATYANTAYEENVV